MPDGTAVCNIAGAYDVGFGDKKRTQWIDCSIWGKQAEAVSQYLTKGSQIVIYADDLEIETYQKNDGGQGHKLKCRVNKLDFAGSKQDGQQAQPARQQAQQRQQSAPVQQAQQQAPSVDDWDDDIPFN
jgi:single-strand DNA-binding protein